MINKAYVIVHDGTHILLGQGGKSGAEKTIRKGYHLPGGTVERTSTPKNTVIKELKEETGIQVDESQIEQVTKFNDKFGKKEYCVSIFITKVESVQTLVNDFKRPEVTNEFDEPFESLLSLQSKDSWDNENFNDNFGTGWFKAGLIAAKDIISPQ